MFPNLGLLLLLFNFIGNFKEKKTNLHNIRTAHVHIKNYIQLNTPITEHREVKRKQKKRKKRERRKFTYCAHRDKGISTGNSMICSDIWHKHHE